MDDAPYDGARPETTKTTVEALENDLEVLVDHVKSKDGECRRWKQSYEQARDDHMAAAAALHAMRQALHASERATIDLTFQLDQLRRANYHGLNEEAQRLRQDHLRYEQERVAWAQEKATLSHAIAIETSRRAELEADVAQQRHRREIDAASHIAQHERDKEIIASLRQDVAHLEQELMDQRAPPVPWAHRTLVPPPPPSRTKPHEIAPNLHEIPLTDETLPNTVSDVPKSSATTISKRILGKYSHVLPEAT
ncbi:hypothetical protein ACHHYP_01851 [Achlya hypogyna]|uniref:Uncharacterized protein n=1 Tax=Achlya hypogyna TaxID=1202772 RepID=A0A1V9Z802_ACHHY|nr:hypothetical protein ACHHYP_01851 [Achlya hypogyna]